MGTTCLPPPASTNNIVSQLKGVDLIGQTVSHYRITEKLGKGGMGEVYLAEDTSLKRNVALKLLPETLQQDPTSHKRFIREAESAAALDHPFVCKIYEVGEHDGRNFIAMEYLKGQTLKERLAEGPIPLDEALRLGSEIAEALEEAHERGIVHRDLKPSNIMLTPKGHAQVLDFGLAKRVVEDGQEITADVTREGTTLGTLAYMSPEQLRGKTVDTRSDTFSFAVVLHEMLTGVHPFRKAEPVQTITAILHEETKELSCYTDSAPEALSQMVKKMLTKDPAERFQSIQEVVTILNDPSAPWKIHAQPLLGRQGLLALIPTLILTIALVSWWALRESTTTVTPVLTSIAVLPLANLSGDPEQEYFVDGMTDALITDLSKIGSLKVSARKSAMSYKDSEKPLAEIAQELDVEALLEGSVLREGNRVRITVQLIEAATDRNLWADRYERNLTSILALQGEVAQAIAGEIQVTLTPEEQTVLTRSRQVDPEAYEAYLKGQFHWGKLTPPDLETALQYYEIALEKDPNYAPAYAGIAMAWSGLQQFGFVRPREAGPKAREAALRAVELDAGSVEAQYALAMVRTWTDWDWKRAEAAFQRGIELNPNYPDVRAYYSHFLTMMKRPEEALAEMERVVELDPFNSLFRSLYGIVLLYTGHEDDAIEQFRRVHRTEPDHPVAFIGLMETYHAKRMPEELLAETKAYYGAMQDREALESLTLGEGEDGLRGAMIRLAETLAARLGSGPVLATDIPQAYAFAGENELAIEWLETAFEEHDPNMPYLAVSRAWDDLRNDSRFQDLLRQMNLP